MRQLRRRAGREACPVVEARTALRPPLSRNYSSSVAGIIAEIAPARIQLVRASAEAHRPSFGRSFFTFGLAVLVLPFGAPWEAAGVTSAIGLGGEALQNLDS
jgi:hypothetical protein